MAGTNLYRSSVDGTRRKRMTRIAKTKSLHNDKSTNACHGYMYAVSQRLRGLLCVYALPWLHQYT